MKRNERTENRDGVRMMVTAILAASAILLAGAGVARATIVASDTFTAPDGTALSGRATEVGGLIWSITTDRPLTINSDAVTALNEGSAVVPFSPGGISSPLFSVAASLDMTTTTSGNWFGLGFADSAAQNQNHVFFNGHGLLWMLLTDNGNYQLFKNGTTSTISSGAAPVFHSGAGNDVLLAYNPSNTVVSLTINSQSIYNAPVAGINPALIAQAGFQFTTTGSIDNFVLAQVPEPSSVMLLGVGAAVLWLGRRAKK